MIYDEVNGLGVKFIVFDSDMTRFDGVYVNSMLGDLANELCDILFNEEGEENVEMLDKFPTEIVRDGASVIVCGFIYQENYVYCDTVWIYLVVIWPLRIYLVVDKAV